MQKIAILGGTHFIGVHLLLALYREGHQITLYNRDLRIPPVPYPTDIELIKGDRNNSEDLKGLFKKDFDVVFDLSGYTLKHVQPITQNYKSSIGHYIFCSSPIVIISQLRLLMLNKLLAFLLKTPMGEIKH